MAVYTSSMGSRRRSSHGSNCRVQSVAVQAGAPIAGQVLGKNLYVTGNIDLHGANTAAIYDYRPGDVRVGPASLLCAQQHGDNPDRS